MCPGSVDGPRGRVQLELGFLLFRANGNIGLELDAPILGYPVVNKLREILNGDLLDSFTAH